MLAILIRCYNKQIFKADKQELFQSRGYTDNLFKPLLSGAWFMTSRGESLAPHKQD